MSSELTKTQRRALRAFGFVIGLLLLPLMLLAGVWALCVSTVVAIYRYGKQP